MLGAGGDRRHGRPARRPCRQRRVDAATSPFTEGPSLGLIPDGGVLASPAPPPAERIEESIASAISLPYHMRLGTGGDNRAGRPRLGAGGEGLQQASRSPRATSPCRHGILRHGGSMASSGAGVACATGCAEDLVAPWPRSPPALIDAWSWWRRVRIGPRSMASPAKTGGCCDLALMEGQGTPRLISEQPLHLGEDDGVEIHRFELRLFEPLP
jgi:hypothetical protein